MDGWAAVGWFFALPVAAGLLGLCWPESRKMLSEAARHDARRIKGRIRHPLMRQSQPQASREPPWDGWAP
jgi:hypothetical protein